VAVDHAVDASAARHRLEKGAGIEAGRRVVERPAIHHQVYRDDVPADETVDLARGVRGPSHPTQAGKRQEDPPAHQKACRTRTSSA